MIVDLAAAIRRAAGALLPNLFDDRCVRRCARVLVAICEQPCRAPSSMRRRCLRIAPSAVSGNHVGDHFVLEVRSPSRVLYLRGTVRGAVCRPLGGGPDAAEAIVVGVEVEVDASTRPRSLCGRRLKRLVKRRPSSRPLAEHATRHAFLDRSRERAERVSTGLDAREVDGEKNAQPNGTTAATIRPARRGAGFLRSDDHGAGTTKSENCVTMTIRLSEVEQNGTRYVQRRK